MGLYPARGMKKAEAGLAGVLVVLTTRRPSGSLTTCTTCSHIGARSGGVLRHAMITQKAHRPLAIGQAPELSYAAKGVDGGLQAGGWGNVTSCGDLGDYVLAGKHLDDRLAWRKRCFGHTVS